MEKEGHNTETMRLIQNNGVVVGDMPHLVAMTTGQVTKPVTKNRSIINEAHLIKWNVTLEGSVSCVLHTQGGTG